MESIIKGAFDMRNIAYKIIKQKKTSLSSMIIRYFEVVTPGLGNGFLPSSNMPLP